MLKILAIKLTNGLLDAAAAGPFHIEEFLLSMEYLACFLSICVFANNNVLPCGTHI